MVLKMIDPWGKGGIKDYDKICKDFGVGRFEKFVAGLADAPIFMKRGLVYGERDFAKIVEAIKNKTPFALLTGLMPSGKFHFGHMIVAQQIIYYQSLGADIFIVVADVESFLTRGINFEEAEKIAIEEYILNYIALGLKPEKCKIYFQSQGGKEYNLLSKIAANHTTLNEMKGVYGEIEPNKIVSALTQVADILLPQLDGKVPTIVPVGFDQMPHINLTRDIASRMKEYDFLLPSATYHKFVPGLQGGKMSSSSPNSHIALTDDPDTVKKKINGAFSGGQETIALHKEKGGNPDVDVPFLYLKYLFEPNDKKLAQIEKNYRSGKLLTGELKQIVIEKINAFLKIHQNKREKARKSLDSFFSD
jgi:tryptophanyl-tRNA synthetase